MSTTSFATLSTPTAEIDPGIAQPAIDNEVNSGKTSPPRGYSYRNA